MMKLWIFLLPALLIERMLNAMEINKNTNSLKSSLARFVETEEENLKLHDFFANVDYEFIKKKLPKKELIEAFVCSCSDKKSFKTCMRVLNDYKRVLKIENLVYQPHINTCYVNLKNFSEFSSLVSNVKEKLPLNFRKKIQIVVAKEFTSNKFRMSAKIKGKLMSK